MRIDKAGVYDMSADDYHADPCAVPSLSSSIGKMMLTDTPQHAWTNHPMLNPNFERDEDGKFVIGNTAHSLMLNDPKRFAILQFDDYRKKEAQAARDQARIDGRIPILAEQFARVEEMVSAGRAQLVNHRDASDAFTNGKPEQTLIWSEDIDGAPIWFRIRLDWLPDDLKIFDDYKTTECANPDSWQRVVDSVRHDFQAAFYRRGIRAVLGIRNPKMRFIVQEPRAPFALCAIDLSPEYMELADRDVDIAVRRWAWCLENNRWPGYPSMTCTLAPRAWAETQKMERELRDHDVAERAGKPTADLIELGLAFQRPI